MIRSRDGYWQLRVDRGRDLLTGKRRFVYGRAATNKAAEKLEARLVTEVADGRHKGTDVKTVGALVDRYVDWCEHVKELSPGTVANYRRHAELRRRGRMVRMAAGTDPKTGATRYRTQPGPLSPSSIHEIHSILSGALQQAVKWRWIAHNPARLASPPSVKKTKVHLPAADQVAGLLRAALAEDPRFGLFLRMAVILGARRGELCALRWHHVDFEHDEVVIERGIVYVPGRPLLDKETKRDNQRRIAADATTMELLRAHQKACATALAELGGSLQADAYVFSYAVDGSIPMHPPAVTHKFERLARKHSLGCRLHDLRHFMVTNALDGGVALPTVAGRAGHSDGGRVTLATYAHWQRARTATPEFAELGRLDQVTLVGPAGRVRHTTRLTAAQRGILAQLGVAPPPPVTALDLA